MSINLGYTNQSSKGKQSTVIAPQTAAEAGLQQTNLELAQLQLAQMRDAAAKQAAYEASPQGQLDQQIQQQASQNLLSRITGQAPILTDAQSAMLNQMYDPYAQQAQADLKRSAEENAAMRGMTLADSPTGGEYLRQQALLGNQLAGTRANAALNLGQAQDIFNTNLKNFQDQLRQQSYQNRLQFANSTPGSYAMQNMLLAQRMPNMTRTFSGEQSGYNVGGGGSAGYGANGFSLGGGYR